MKPATRAVQFYKNSPGMLLSRKQPQPVLARRPRTRRPGKCRERHFLASTATSASYLFQISSHLIVEHCEPISYPEDEDTACLSQLVHVSHLQQALCNVHATARFEAVIAQRKLLLLQKSSQFLIHTRRAGRSVQTCFPSIQTNEAGNEEMRGKGAESGTTAALTGEVENKQARLCLRLLLRTVFLSAPRNLAFSLLGVRWRSWIDLGGEKTTRANPLRLID